VKHRVQCEGPQFPGQSAHPLLLPVNARNQGRIANIIATVRIVTSAILSIIGLFLSPFERRQAMKNLPVHKRFGSTKPHAKSYKNFVKQKISTI
jgi:hypothetical protein